MPDGVKNNCLKILFSGSLFFYEPWCVSGFGQLDFPYSFFNSGYGFFSAHQLCDVKHVGALAFAYNAQAECVHDISEVVAFVGNPCKDVGFGIGAFP